MSLRFAIRLHLAVFLCASVGVPAVSEVSFFQMQSREDFLAGTLDGIALDPLGSLSLASRGRRIAELSEPFLFSAAASRQGWVIGTGNSGSVFRISRDGETTKLFATAEPEVFAVWADADGVVFAGSSPDGKVYRYANGKAEVFFDPEETYIWALARARDGALLVATGTEGRLYKVGSKGEGEVLFDSEDTHIRSLAVLPNGDILAGTAGDGLVLRISPTGSARTLFDGEAPEVVDFAVADDGVAYATVLASEASLTDLSGRRSSQQNGQSEQGNGGSVRVTVSPANGQGDESSGSRPRGFKGPRSEILRLTRSGSVERAWSFDDETVYSIAWQDDRLWVGTGLEGKVYSLRRGQLVLEKDVEERQIVALVADQPGPAFATTNAAAFYRVSRESEAQGTYTSPSLDAGQSARFGSIRWRGSEGDGNVRISARSGVSSKPDKTWSDWTSPASGSEVSLADVPPGRFIQWRAELSAGSGPPVIRGVELSYQQINLPPRIKSLEVLDPGEVVVPSSFNPSSQVYEPAHPNRDGIFTSLRPASPREERRRGKSLWKKGFRTLRWDVEDPNEDRLRYEISFQPAGASDWLPMAEDLDDQSYSFDSTALPDGYYRFRLRALDREQGELEAPLSAEEVSVPVLIDHGAPRLVSSRAAGDGYQVVVGDDLNPLRAAEVSVDAGEWRPIRPQDGLLDGKRETLTVQAPKEARLVLLRLTDAAFNVVTFDLRQQSR